MQDRPGYRQAIQNGAFRHGKMVFVSGPRQVGKTTLARLLGQDYERTDYHTWDDPTFRRQWAKDPKALVSAAVGKRSLLILDELHKAPRWKTHLKALFDLRGASADILVTGSARMDVFRRGGDSLVGRYFPLRLHPFSMGEILQDTLPPAQLVAALGRKQPGDPKLLNRLLAFGGFPEPFLKQDPEFTVLWRRSRGERLVREDLRDLAHAHDLSSIETMSALIPERVGSPFSLQSLTEDLGVAYATAKRWLGWLGSVYVIHLVPPYAKTLARALRKQPKAYLWDWSEVPDRGARFENLVAGHLRKACDAWTDTGKGTFELFYVRDKEKREVDFLITSNRKPWLLAECKLSDKTPSPALGHFARVLRPALTVQLIAAPGVHDFFDVEGAPAYVVSADRFLRLLP